MKIRNIFIIFLVSKVKIYSNGYQETVATSLEYGDITIEDLERNNIEFIKHKKDMSN